MAEKISDYPNTVSSLQDTDLLDVSVDLGGGSYESQKMPASVLDIQQILELGSSASGLTAQVDIETDDMIILDSDDGRLDLGGSFIANFRDEATNSIVSIGNDVNITPMGDLVATANSMSWTSANAQSFTANGGDIRLILTDSDFQLQIPSNADPNGNVVLPLEGGLLFDSTDMELQVYDGSSWVSVMPDGNGMFDAGNDGNTWDVGTVNVNVGGTTIVLGDEQLAFDSTSGLFRVHDIGASPGDKIFQVSVGTGGNDAISVERTGSQNHIRFNDAGNWGFITGMNYAMQLFSNQYDTTTRAVLSYHTVSNEYSVGIGRTVSGINIGLDLEKDLHTNNTPRYGSYIKKSGTAAFSDSGTNHISYGMAIEDIGSYAQSGTGNASKIGLYIDVTGSTSTGVAAENVAIRVFRGRSELREIEIQAGDVLIMTDDTLGDRIPITFNNGSFEFGPPL